MIGRKFMVSLMAASMIAAPATRVAAGNDAAALLGGAILGGIIVNEVNKNKQRKAAAAAAARRNAAAHQAQKQMNRDIQTALNFFGYDAGPVDGAIGRRSRAAISRFQAEMGYTADGYLDDFERDFLLSSYQRALASANVPPYNQILATQGQRGLLRTFRNEQLGIPTQAPPIQSAVAPAPAPAPTPAPQPRTGGGNAALPSFTFGQNSRSIGEHCNEIGVLTAANGGLTAAGRVADSEFALNEQFCLARTNAMAESSRLEEAIPNMTPEQVVQQCKGLSQALAASLANITSQRPSRVIADTSAFLRESGKPLDQLAAGGRVCLGVGYRTDDAQMALASAVLLVGAGQLGYGEVVSHHLREGFGVSQARPDLAKEWMRMTLNAVRNGGTAVLGQSADRLAVLAEATDGATGTGATALPAFPTTGGN